jgi:Uncharacterized protein conserved in bacteria
MSGIVDYQEEISMNGVHYNFPPFVWKKGVRAEIDQTGKYRYLLELPFRQVPKKKALVILKNPSIADGQAGDQTANRVAKYLYLKGYDKVTLANLYAYRSPEPKDLVAMSKKWGIDAVIGPHNDAAITVAAQEADLIILAYGTPPGSFKADYDRRISQVKTLLKGKEIWHVGKCNIDGYPLHGMVWGFNLPLNQFGGL